MSRLYRAREFAKLAGVTVRTLHYYDRLKLVEPRRTQAGYRLYGARDLERLEQIVALKFLGFSLEQIGMLLDQDTRGLSEVLRAQRRALEEKRRRLEAAIEAIREAEDAIGPDQQTDAVLLKKIIEVIAMQDGADLLNQYYSQEARAKLAERRQEWTPEMQEQATAAWTALFRDVEASLHEDPASEKAQALAARWKSLVDSFTGGDPQVGAGLKRAWADREHWPAPLQQQTAPFSNPKVWEFMGKAMACGK